MTKPRLLFFLLPCFLLTSCFQIEGVHVLHYYGDSDSGSYRITINRALLNQDKYSDMLDQLKKWSRPKTRSDDDNVIIEDDSGDASMEHFYDTYKCVADLDDSDYVDCRFAFKVPESVGSLAGWSVDWEVVLQPRMIVVRSDHQRTRRVDGMNRLVWYFDGNRESRASVDFTVKVPKAN